MNRWFLAMRPRTLTASVVPVAVGTAVAYALGSAARLSLYLSVLALVAALAIQIATNFFNDVIDFERGADSATRLGPTRVTQAGLIAPQLVVRGALVCLLVAMLCGFLLVQRGGWPIFWIGISSLICGYCYTGGPFPLAYRGLGELFVLIFFGIIAVGGVVLLQLERWPFEALLAGLQVGLLAVVLIAINNLRDAEGDGKAGKYTLAVILGPQLMRTVIALACLAPIFLGSVWIARGEWAAGILPVLLLPKAISLVRAICRTEPGTIFNSFLAQAALLHLLFGSLLVLGLLSA